MLIKREKFQSQTIGLPHSTIPCLILGVTSARLGSDKYINVKVNTLIAMDLTPTTRHTENGC